MRLHDFYFFKLKFESVRVITQYFFKSISVAHATNFSNNGQCIHSDKIEDSKLI